MPIDPQNPPRYRCLHEFAPKEEGEIRASVGELFVLSPGDDGIFDTEDDMNDGWLYVSNLATGETGFVPLEYMKEIQEPSPRQSFSPSSSSVPQQTPPQTNFSPPPVNETKERTDYTSPNTSSSGPPIRRFSDPRLAEHLLNNMDPKAMEGTSSSRSSVDMMSSSRQPRTPQQQQQQQQQTKSKTPLSSSMSPFSPSLSSSSKVPGMGSPSTSRLSSSTSRLGSPSVSPLLSKFRSAGKKVQSANRIKSVVSGPPRTPALATAVASEDYNELFKRNEDFYRKLTSNRNESFQVLQDMVEQLGKKIQSTTQRSNDLVSSLQQLDEMIDEERRKWKQQNELEKNEATKGRSRLSQLNDDREVGEEKTF